MIQVTVEKVGVDQDGEQAVILLCDLGKTTLIPIWVRLLEATAIALPLQGLQSPRPLTADLLVNVLSKLGARVVLVTISEIKDGIFYATMVLQSGSEEFEIDCRPSDAIAVALRTGVPVYVSEKVMAEAGVAFEDANVQ